MVAHQMLPMPSAAGTVSCKGSAGAQLPEYYIFAEAEPGECDPTVRLPQKWVQKQIVGIFEHQSIA